MDNDRDVPAPARWPWWQFLCFVGLVLPVALVVGAMAGGFIKFAEVDTVAGRPVLFTHVPFVGAIEKNGTPSKMDYTFSGHTASVDATEVIVNATTKIAIPAATKQVELSWYKDELTVVADQTVLWNKKL